MIRILLAVGMLMLIPAGIVLAGESYTTVTALELKAMMDRKEPALLVIDTRTPSEYQEAHIRGAISIPWVSFEKDPSLISYPKSAKIVFYCNGFS